MTSEYYPRAIKVCDRPIWQVRKRANRLITFACVVWSGIDKESCRRALAELRELEEWNTRHWPKCVSKIPAP